MTTAKEHASEILGNYLHLITIHIVSNFLAPHSPHRPTSRELTYPISLPWQSVALQLQTFSTYCLGCRTLLQDSQHIGIGSEWWVVQTLQVTPEEERGDNREPDVNVSEWEGFGGRLVESWSDAMSSTTYGLSRLVPHINSLISSFIRLFASSSSSSGLILPFRSNLRKDRLYDFVLFTFGITLALLPLLLLFGLLLLPKSSQSSLSS